MSKSGAVSVVGFIQTHRIAAGGLQDRTVPPPNPFEKANLSKCENVG